MPCGRRMLVAEVLPLDSVPSPTPRAGLQPETLRSLPDYHGSSASAPFAPRQESRRLLALLAADRRPHAAETPRASRTQVGRNGSRLSAFYEHGQTSLYRLPQRLRFLQTEEGKTLHQHKRFRLQCPRSLYVRGMPRRAQSWPWLSCARGRLTYSPGITVTRTEPRLTAACGHTGPRGAPYRKEGGMYSAGSTGGSGWPAMATSMRCMARMNSSAVSFPSWSMSERFLVNKKLAVIWFHGDACWLLLMRHLMFYFLILTSGQ